MAVMKPFELVFELGSNITLRNHAIHLDGLLSNACYRHTGCSEKALTLLDDLLLFDAKHRMYHGSAMAFGVTPEQSITARTPALCGGLCDCGTIPCCPVKSPRPALNSTVRSRSTVALNDRGLISTRPFIHRTWCFMGWVILSALTGWCSSIVPGWALMPNSGSGTVNHVAIKEIDQDFSCIDAHGQIARNLPVSWLKARINTGSTLPPDAALNLDNGEDLPVCAPYWHSHHRFTTTEAVAVEKIRRVII